MIIKCSHETCSDCLSFIANGNQMPSDCADTIKALGSNPEDYTVMTARWAQKSRVTNASSEIQEKVGLSRKW